MNPKFWYNNALYILQILANTAIHRMKINQITIYEPQLVPSPRIGWRPQFFISSLRTQLWKNTMQQRQKNNLGVKSRRKNRHIHNKHRLRFFQKNWSMKRPIHFGNSARLRTGPCPNTSSIKARTSLRSSPFRQRNSWLDRHKRHSSGWLPLTASLSVPCYKLIAVPKKDGGARPEINLKEMCKSPPFQNGWAFTYFEICYSQTIGWYLVENRPERRLFCGSHLKKSPGIPTISLEILAFACLPFGQRLLPEYLQNQWNQ